MKTIKLLSRILQSKYSLVYNNKAIFGLKILQVIKSMSDEFDEDKLVGIDVAKFMSFESLIGQKKRLYLIKQGLLDTKTKTTKKFAELITEALTLATSDSVRIQVDSSSFTIDTKADTIILDESIQYHAFIKAIATDSFSISDFIATDKIIDKYLPEHQIKYCTYNVLRLFKNILLLYEYPVVDSLSIKYLDPETQITIDSFTYEHCTSSYSYFNTLTGEYEKIPIKRFIILDSIKTYTYRAKYKGEEFDLISFEHLELNEYTMAGFVLLSNITNMPYIMTLQSIKHTQDIDLQKMYDEQKGSHAFHKLFNLIYSHANNVGQANNFKILKNKGQAYALTMLLGFIMYSITKTRFHSIFLGGQDTGKTYVTSVLGSVFFQDAKFITSDFSRAGLIAASNQTVQTPLNTYSHQIVFGAITKKLLVLEEFVDKYNELNPEHQEIMSTIKTGAIENSVESAKFGSNKKIPFNANIIITGNYNAGKLLKDYDTFSRGIFSFRQSILNYSDVDSTNSFKLDSNSIFGSSTDIASLRPYFENLTLSNLSNILKTYDIYDNARMTNPIIKVGYSYLEGVYAKQNKELRTGFPNALIKRFKFNVFSTSKEVDNTSSILSETSKHKVQLTYEDKLELYLRDLDVFIKNLYMNNKQTLDDEAKLSYYSELVLVYDKYVHTIGKDTFDNLFTVLYDVILGINGESIPSNDSREILERHLFFQSTSMHPDLIDNFVKLRQKFNIRWIHEIANDK